MKKLAVCLPGKGYTLDYPLFYYSKQILKQAGYELCEVDYRDISIKGEMSQEERMMALYELALKRTYQTLELFPFSDYEDVLFVGKSMGTMIAASIASGHPQKEKIRHILYTPLEETFRTSLGKAIAFSGTMDPWVGEKDSRIGELCREKNVFYVEYKGANHSLNTGDVERDLEILQDVMKKTKQFVGRTYGI